MTPIIEFSREREREVISERRERGRERESV